MMSRETTIAWLAVLFAAGVICGVAGSSYYHTDERDQQAERGPAAKHDRIMTFLTQELALTAEQQVDLEPIVMRTHVAILEIRYAHQANIEAVLTKGMTDSKTKLSPEQQTRLDAMSARLQRRWAKSREYLDITKRRVAWFAPSHPLGERESPLGARGSLDAPDAQDQRTRRCRTLEPGMDSSACVVRIKREGFDSSRSLPWDR